MPPSCALHRNHVCIVGDTQAAQTLVFVHGFGTDQSTWDKIVPAFSGSHRIVLLDNVGAGQSDPGAFVQHRYLSLPPYADDLLEVCAALELRDAVVIGHSAGGMIAALSAMDRPEHFAQLVLIGASPCYLDSADGYVGGFSQDTLQQTYRAVMSNFMGWIQDFSPIAVNAPDQPEIAEHFAATLRRIPPEHALTVLCSILQSDHRADLARLRTPTLVIQSSEDFFVPQAVAEYLHRHIAHSQLAQIEARGHFPHLTAPAQVIEAIRRVL